MKDWRETLAKLWNTSDKEVLIASHRGKFSSSVMENTSLAFLTAIREGAHMVEMDLDMTKDGHLVGHHDKTMDRLFHKNTPVSAWTLEELRGMPFYNYVGEVCAESVETFEQILEALENQTILVLDKCWDYWDDVYRVLKVKNMVEQAIFKFYLEDEQAFRWAKEHEDCVFIPMSGNVSDFERLLELRRNTSVPALEILPERVEDEIFKESSFKWLKDHKFKVWCNSLSLAKRLVYGAGYDDLISLRYGGDQGWGKLIDRGVTILQTDWPCELGEYLRQRR